MTDKMKRNFKLLALATLFSLFLVSQALCQGIITGRVVGISDGDTITVLQNKTQYKIRLYGIDTPEMGQDFGAKAKQFTSELVFGKEVQVVAETMDQYGRIVGTVFVNNICVNERIVKEGYAWVYRKYCDRPVCNLWLQYENQAKTNRLGLWNHLNPVPPWEFRHAKSDTPNTITTELKQSQQTEIVYHGNVRSKIFHQPGCRYYNCKNCVAIFNSRDEAIEAGYRACRVCRP